MFLVTAPIYRMFYYAPLGAHWLLLAAIYLFLRQDDYTDIRKPSIYWAVLGFLIAGIHLYFLPMCFLFVVGSTAKSVIESRKMKAVNILPVVCFVIGAYINICFLGGFSSGASKSARGLGQAGFRFNLNAWFDGQNFSRIMLGEENVSTIVAEGFAYLGFGIIGIVFIEIISIVRNILSRKNRVSNNEMKVQKIILWVICVISLIMAVSPVVAWGDHILFQYHIPQVFLNLWATFRVTGRLVWPAWYILTIYCIKGIADLNIEWNAVKKIILVLLLALQLFDISSTIKVKHELFAKRTIYEYPNDHFWEKLSKYREFRCICFSYPGESSAYNVEIGGIALKYDWVLNAFYFARNIEGLRSNEDTLWREEPQSDCIYIFLPNQTDLMHECEHELRYYDLGEYIVGVTWLDADANVNDFSYE